MKALAHIDGIREEPLLSHLLEVANRSESNACVIRPDDARFHHLAFWTGLLHDLGKYRAEFQDYLRGRRPRSHETQHAVFGAAWAWGHAARAVALAINGHHSGLQEPVVLEEKTR